MKAMFAVHSTLVTEKYDIKIACTMHISSPSRIGPSSRDIELKKSANESNATNLKAKIRRSEKAQKAIRINNEPSKLRQLATILKSITVASSSSVNPPIFTV